MNNGNKRRDRRRQSSSKRYRVRYDRIVAAVLVLIVLIVIPASCMKSCKDGKKDNKKKQQDKTSASDVSGTDNTTGGSSDPTIIDNLITSDETSSILTSSDKAETTTAEYITENHSSDDLSCGNLILVNQAHQYTFPESDAEPVTLYDHIKTDFYSVSDYVMRLDSETINQLNSMMEAFNKETGSNDIMIIGGFRTLEEQNDKYNSGSSQYQGGYTDYHTARSFDMGIFPKDGSSSGFYSPTGIYTWIDEHAADYGFIVRYPEGKDSITGEAPRTQTYRYVGVPHATYIKENGICLEEYIDAVKEYNSSKPLEITVDSKVYHVYYVPAGSGGNTAVPVPANKTYTVSGNNSDGFIVTANMN